MTAPTEREAIARTIAKHSASRLADLVDAVIAEHILPLRAALAKAERERDEARKASDEAHEFGANALEEVRVAKQRKDKARKETL